jgi:hypothetical protein
MILPSLTFTLIQVFQLRPEFIFDLHLPILTRLEKGFYAVRTGAVALDFAIIEIGSPSLFNGFINRIDSDAAD